ncbi:glutamate dehydrogenase [Friedmanniella endophytica]|uniref:Glutamate dehydrogenase n=1 Tax=Microlunatus kandeliicorticis TaxID=1759536 RepID=A0A7W3IU83_9ACTN|nr:NAD-glutamate dehydrogenase [Microlunatus kandeliicorticis]MBA8795319.1 glutamate dehydrogenase [Microlunatus kandeliicorticis]
MIEAEAEAERDKAAKLATIADRGAAIAREVGQDPAVVQRFLRHYFRHVDAEDIDERGVEDLLGLVESHYRMAMHRRPGEPAVAVFDPAAEGRGWDADGATVAQVVTDDHPFLVDSITMEVIRQGWSLHEVYHPQFPVRREPDGTLIEILPSDRAGAVADAVPESWMHLELTPPAGGASSPEEERRAEDALAEGFREVLRTVGVAVDDWDAMRRVALEVVDGLGRVPASVPAEQVRTAVDLLAWLAADHFTFLGYRRYRVDLAHPDTMAPVPGTGLGTLRDDAVAATTFVALPHEVDESARGDGVTAPPLLEITKTDERSRVHRPAYLDYIGVGCYDETGALVGQHRFLGLFSSAAYHEPVSRVPVIAAKADAVLRRSGYDPESHGGKAIMDVLNTYPRDELFQASVAELSYTVERIAHLKERRQVRLFCRREPHGRYVSCLVFLPRDRYTTDTRTAMERVLLDELGGSSIDYTARSGDSVLARLHFVVRRPVGEPIGELDVPALEQRLAAVCRTWDDAFTDQVAEATERLTGTGGSRRAASRPLLELMDALPEGYKEDYTPRQALKDLEALNSLRAGSIMELALFRPEHPDDEADLRLKIFRREASLSLSRVLPHLSLLGVDVIDERPYELRFTDGRRAFVYDFGLRVPGGPEAVGSRWTPEARQRFMDAFRSSYEGSSEPDAYNRLVMAAGLDWRQVSLLRAIGRYLRQGGISYSQSYLATALSSNVDLARLLTTMFAVRFEPDLEDDQQARTSRSRELARQIQAALDDVASLDHDRIIRSFLAVINATVRTNVYVPGTAVTTLKLLPRKIPGLPEPRPAFEIFVYAPRVEGVHLRFGAVARGGLRWSDRAEDFRTEILGLVKAQMVKNTVIVPVGAKGGFYAKQLPDPSVDRDAWMAEGIAAYRLFVSGLLDVTDNIVDGAVVPPERVLRYDDDDPYLVVAADKGTATFSDLANGLALEKGFWLGDAFASGGSVGYDHKAMGITAKGAWESVLRHLRELGIDGQHEDFRCVGIGDMSGDVFGNGMLLSRHIRLVAAFDHRHVFVDPDPDPERSWAERRRMFDLPRSSWADYDTALISAGGGVFPRTVKSITITEPMRTALGIEPGVQALSPTELITAILKAPVDLLWNGGIGTYVKSTAESHADVGDKANDAVRVNGADLRARSVGEGGNLGLTQLGRIEYAAAGGLINTDFIDNSAGVDTSDHEVNIKILLAAEVAAGRLSEEDRDTLLASMTDEVAALVLANNRAQNTALANAVHQAPSMAGVHEDWMHRLEEQSLLDRRIESMPSTEEMTARRERGEGLRSPELCTLLAYTKIVLEREVLGSDLPDDPALHHFLVDYFPSALRERYADRMDAHRLHREIITTLVVNEFVNTSGISCYHRLSGETGGTVPDVIRAHLAARAIFDADALEARIRELDHQVAAGTQTRLRLEVRTLVERATRWLVNNRRSPIDIGAAVEQFRAGVQAVTRALPDVLQGREQEARRARAARSVEEGVPEALAGTLAGLPAAYGALTIVQTAGRTGHDPVEVARVHFALGERLGIDVLLTRIIELPRDDRWQTMARAALRDDLHSVHAALTAEVLAVPVDGTTGADARVEAWEQQAAPIGRAVQTLGSICAGEPDLARMSVGLQVVRGLLPAEG